uniref:U17-Liphistoxin-Lm1a_1 n=1 Tax=Liphistius malayanus TaxID=1203467 RepID=A0A482ZDU1_9ARAC
MKSEMNFVSVLCITCIVGGLALEPPHIETYPKDQIIVRGGRAYFVCTASGDPNPQIEWLKNGRRVNSHRYTIQKMLDGSVLRIGPVRNGSDDATFECRAENGIGDPSESFFDITVLAEDKLPSGFPKFTRQPNMQNIEKGKSILMPCEVEGYPEPTIRWMKNMIPLDMRTPRYSLVEGYSLQIIEAEEEDQGQYECIAENSIGSATSYMVHNLC